MSVPKDSRSTSKLDLFVASRNMACYTIQICKNPKVFLPEYGNVTAEIVQLSMRIHNQLWTANQIIVNSAGDYFARRKLQDNACALCNTMLSDIEIAHKLFHLSSKRVIYWTQQIVAIRNAARAWRKSDAERYKEYR